MTLIVWTGLEELRGSSCSPGSRLKGVIQQRRISDVCAKERDYELSQISVAEGKDMLGEAKINDH